MKKCLPFLCCLLLLFNASEIRAQLFPGVLPDGYAGAFAIDLQPAAIAGSGLKLDIVITGLSATFSNDYLDIKKNLFLGKGWKDLSEDTYQESFRENLNGKAKYMSQDVSLYLPSIMIALDRKQSIAFTARARNIVNFDMIEEPGARYAYYLLNLPEQWDQTYDNPQFRMQALSYLELGLSYARVVMDKGPHFLKVGGRVKWLEGMAGFYMYGDQFAYNLHDDSTISVYDAQVQYAHSTGFEQDNGSKPWKELFSGNSGIGLDLGIVYEHRKEGSRFSDLASPYQYKIGFSLTDMGSIGFKQSAGSQDFSGTVEYYDLGLLKANSITDFDSILKANFDYGSGAASFRMQLPMAVSFQFDYRLSEKFFVGFVPYWAVKRPGSPNQTHGLTTYTLMPRYEAKQLGVAMPLTLQDNGRFTMGLTLRAGPLIIGSRNLINLLTNSFVQEADLHVALRIPIPVSKPPEDMDEDGVPDRKDKCPEVAGLEELDGCPEAPEFELKDLEKVALTPIVVPALLPPPLPEISFPVPAPEPQRPLPASVAVQIAPPVLAPSPPVPLATIGLLAIPPALWKELAKPVPGLEPTVVPLAKVDPLDRYLPYGDPDGDGVPNRDDKCPDIPGVATNDGCPEVEEGFYQEDAFQSLYFDVNGTDLRVRSQSSIDIVVAYLKANPSAGVRLAGHTDNSGAERYNVDLSLHRCLSVGAYLLDKGITSDRIKVYHYGETRPAATNTTTVGRQLNRRVDITLYSN